jgi:transcriptional regulator with XRE-family HTH domain
MPPKHRRVDRGTHQGHRLLRMLAEEIRSARLSAGLTQAALGQAAGISGVHVARLEHAEVTGASVLLFARLYAVLGMRLSARPYPEGPPLRDAAHARLLARFAAQLPGSLTFRTEVPLHAAGDLRAWDGEIEGRGATCRLEAETGVSDLQATERRVALKMEDDGVEVVILLVADTCHNRTVLREYRALLQARFPLDTRAVMRELRAGRVPSASGIVIR